VQNAPNIAALVAIPLCQTSWSQTHVNTSPPRTRRLPTSHPTLIKFSAPLFLDVGFTSVGLSLGRSTTCSFVACMGKQVGGQEGGGVSWRAAPRISILHGNASIEHLMPTLCLPALLIPSCCCRSSRSSCWPRGGEGCGGWMQRSYAAAPCMTGQTCSP
jgi:hypothetical protein